MSDWHSSADGWGDRPTPPSGSDDDTQRSEPDDGEPQADSGDQEPGTDEQPSAAGPAVPPEPASGAGDAAPSGPTTPPAVPPPPAWLDDPGTSSQGSTTSSAGSTSSAGPAATETAPSAPSAGAGRVRPPDELGNSDRTRLLLVGGVLVTLVVAVAGFALLTRPESAPTDPYFPLAGVNEVSEPILDVDRNILYVPTSDRIHVFPSPDNTIDFCPRSGNIESEDGQVWSRTGAPLNASAPLDEFPVIIYEDIIYVNVREPQPADASGGGGGASVQPQCTGEGG